MNSNLVNVTAKIDKDIYRRFSAWCRLHRLKIADVLQEFMRDKGDQLSQFEDPKILSHKDTRKSSPGSGRSSYRSIAIFLFLAVGKQAWGFIRDAGVI